MTYDLASMHELIQTLLTDSHIQAAIVGGAARDTYLGRKPKDFDIVILTPGIDPALLRGVISDYAQDGVLNVLAPERLEDYANDNGDRGLLQVVEFLYDDVVVQLIQFTDAKTKQYNGNPQNVVAEHDCDLNRAWFEDVGGRLIVRVSDDFPSPFTGNVNSFTPDWSNAERKAYMQSKFPEFIHV